MTTPYTYIIGWPELDIWYYGVRYASGCHPDDLWNPYKTSSDYVSEFVNIHGEPSVRKVRRTFAHLNDPVSAARLWENKVLKRMKVVASDRWLNKHDGMAPPIGNMNDPVVKAKHQKTLSSPEYKANHRAAMIEAMNRPEVQQKMRKNRNTPEYKEFLKTTLLRPDRLDHRGPKNGRYDSTVYEFVHESGDKFIGTRYDFIQKYNPTDGSISRLINGHYKVTQGWRLVESDLTKMLENSDDIEYNKS